MAQGRYVSTQTGFYTHPDFASWSRDALWLYRYLYENDHVHGVAGIGAISPAVLLAEAKMTAEEFEGAKGVIRRRVRWFADGSYWVVGRIKHTCFTRDGEPSPKHVASVANLLTSVCPELRRAVLKRYPIDTLSMGHPVLPTKTKTKTKTKTVSPSPDPLPSSTGYQQSAPPAGEVNGAGGERDREGGENNGNGTAADGPGAQLRPSLEWSAADGAVIAGVIPSAWRMNGHISKLQTYPPALVLGTVLDLRGSQKRIRCPSSVLLTRLARGWNPSDDNYDRAKGMLRKGG